MSSVSEIELHNKLEHLKELINESIMLATFPN